MRFRFHWLEGLGKVIAFRSKRPENQGCTQHDSKTTDNARGDSSILTDLSHPVSTSSQPGFEEFYTGFPSTVYPLASSPAREASDIAQVALPLVQAFTGVVPVVGAPINAAIGGLLQILQVIDRCDQNKVALDDLISQLYRLYRHLCNAHLPWILLNIPGETS